MLPQRAHPNRHLHVMAWDIVLALAAAVMHFGLVPLEHPWLDAIPGWIWPTLAAIFAFSAVVSWWRHVRQPRR